MQCVYLQQKQELSDIQESIRGNRHEGLKVTHHSCTRCYFTADVVSA